MSSEDIFEVMGGMAVGVILLLIFILGYYGSQFI